MFLPSEADVYGTQNERTAQAQDYTLGTEGVILPSNMRIATLNGTNAWYYLRSPIGHSSAVAIVRSDGGRGGALYNSTNGCVRPALWVNLAD